MTFTYWLPAGLLLLSWMLPLHVPPWVSWHNEAAAALAVLVACAMALFMGRGRVSSDRIGLPSVAIPLLLVIVIALLQYSMGLLAYAGSFWTISFYALVAAMSAAIGYAAIRSERDSNLAGPDRIAGSAALAVFAQTLVVGGLIQTVLVFAQTFGLWQGADWIARSAYETRGTGNLAQPNQAALIFAMAIAGALYLHATGRLRAATAMCSVALLVAALSTTESRSGVVGFCAVALWWVARGGHASGMRRRAVAATASVLALGGSFAAWPRLISAYWLFGSPDEVNLTTSGRLEMWRQLLDAAAIHPWRGWGILQVAQAQNAIAHSYRLVMPATFSHDLWLDIVLWAGIPVACAFLVAACVWAARRSKLSYSADTWFCIAVVLPMATQSFTEFPYAYTYLLFPGCFALGALDAALGIEPAIGVGRRVSALAVALTAAAFAWAGTEYTQVEEDFRVARFEALHVGKVPDGYEKPRVLILTQLGALLEATRIQPAASMRAEDLQTLRDVALLYPWAPAQFRYLAALALNGDVAEARRQLQVMRVIHGEATYLGALERLDEMSAVYPALKTLATP
jgi:hypothetical protein